MGLASLGLGIWQIIVESALEEVLSEDYTSGGALFIACGALLVGVSIVGCLGAYFKWRPLLLAVSKMFSHHRIIMQLCSI